MRSSERARSCAQLHPEVGAFAVNQNDVVAPSDALYDLVVCYAYDARFAEIPELEQRYYAKAADLLEQTAKPGHVAAMIGALTIQLCDSRTKKTYEKKEQEKRPVRGRPPQLERKLKAFIAENLGCSRNQIAEGLVIATSR